MKILLIDDSSFFRNVLIRIFKQYLAEADIVTANNGMEAYDIYNEESPDIIITDLLMPVGTGQEFLRLIKENDRQAKVIVVTADIQKATREEVLQMGALAFINKPLDNEKAVELIALIKEACNA